MIPRKKLLFVQLDLNPPGGGEAVAIWMLQALKDDFDITVITWEQPDFFKINSYYGSSLEDKDLTICLMPAIVRFLVEHIPNDPWHHQRNCCLIRWCKLIQHRFDIVVSTYDEMDFGVKGIQYIHYPFLGGHWNREVYLNQQKHGYSWLIKILETRLRPWRLISGYSFQRMQKNLTLVNSKWTGECYQQIYNAKSRVIYPPVAGDFPEVSWQEKANGFVCISRFYYEKRLEHIIDILAEVRLQYPDIHLHIIGSIVANDRSYYEYIKNKVAQHSSWVFLEENITRLELIQLISKHRYGIHAMENEHFGIAVAEMVQAGCITFVPNSGGQVEIVGNKSRLLYGSKDEAVDKILNVLHSEHQQQELHRYLASRKAKFSTESFMQQICQTVSEFTTN